MRKRPTPHLQRKRNRRDRRVYYPVPELIHVAAGLLARTLTTAKLRFGDPPTDDRSPLQVIQDLIDALPTEREEYTFVGTPAFFKRAGIDLQPHQGNEPELTDEELRRLWRGKA